MRCLICHKLSWSSFCKECQERLLRPSIIKREIERDFFVYSFYPYSHIEDLLLTKHTPQGYIIYKALADITFKRFIKNIKFDTKVYILGVDERVDSGYSHVSILTHSMKSSSIEILHSKLMAKNRVKYAGKSFKFRLENRRDFEYLSRGGIDVILVDDIVTTSLTLKEAKKVLDKKGVNTLFALCLADAKV